MEYALVTRMPCSEGGVTRRPLIMGFAELTSEAIPFRRAELRDALTNRMADGRDT